GRFFRLFNAGFAYTTAGYTRLTGMLLRVAFIVLLVYGGLLVLTGQRFVSTPKGFIPSQDMGYLLINVQLPDSASTERTEEVLKQIEDICMDHPGIRHVTSIAGQSFVLNAFGSNFASMFINLKDFGERRAPELKGEAVANQLRAQFAHDIFDAQVAIFLP